MRGAVRPFVPGPLVIVDETMKERKIVGLGIERGPLTEREKRQFMPPEKCAAVKLEQSRIAGSKGAQTAVPSGYRLDTLRP